MILLRIQAGNDPDKIWAESFDLERPIRQKLTEIIERRKMTGDLPESFSSDRASVEYGKVLLPSLDIRPMDIPKLQPLDILTVWDTASELGLILVSHPDKEPRRVDEIHVDPRQPLKDQARFMECLTALARGRTFRHRTVKDGKFKLFLGDGNRRISFKKELFKLNKGASCHARVEPDYFWVFPPWRYQIIAAVAVLVALLRVGIFMWQMPKEYNVRFLVKESEARVVIKRNGRNLHTVTSGAERGISLPHGTYELEILPRLNPIFSEALTLPPNSSRRSSKQDYIIDIPKRIEKSDRFSLGINGFIGPVLLGNRIDGLEINGFPVELPYFTEAWLDNLPIGEYEIRYSTQPDSALSYDDLANSWDHRRPWLVRFDKRTFRWDFRNCSAGDTARITFVYRQIGQ